MIDATRKWLYSTDYEPSCFFRSALNPPDLKVMIQVTERCNMHCKHCFLSATKTGEDLTFEQFENHLINKLVKANVKKVTLTGGEPLLNGDLVNIMNILCKVGIQCCICTNATLVTEAFLQDILNLDVHFNVSLDGMTHTSHGRLRGNESKAIFDDTLKNIRLIGAYNMLNGVLTTPNQLSSIEEYRSICDFAIDAGAKYFLMNPLSPFGRGASAIDLVMTSESLTAIRKSINTHITEKGIYENFEVVYIRFPNEDVKPTPSCQAGIIPYIFTNGDIAICPYIAFAAENQGNNYSSSDFIIGNAFNDIDIKQAIEKYRIENRFCQYGAKENLGCVAMKVSRNLSLDEFDVL